VILKQLVFGIPFHVEQDWWMHGLDQVEAFLEEPEEVQVGLEEVRVGLEGDQVVAVVDQCEDDLELILLVLEMMELDACLNHQEVIEEVVQSEPELELESELEQGSVFVTKLDLAGKEDPSDRNRRDLCLETC
jgi:hypothetical protein